MSLFLELFSIFNFLTFITYIYSVHKNKNISQVINTNNSKEIEQETKNKSDQKFLKIKKKIASNIEENNNAINK